MRFVPVLWASGTRRGRRLSLVPSRFVPNRCVVRRLLTGALLALSAAAGAGQSEPIAEGQVLVRGATLSIYDDGVANDTLQTINVGERTRIRTCFGVPPDSVTCGSISPGDPRIDGLEVRAELRGPELPTAQELSGLPGGSLLLPGFQQEGDYSVENIRLIDGSGDTVAFAQPSVALIHVRDIVLASARVRALSLDELRARGIAFDAENFHAFDFRVGFAFEDEIVEFELPVAYDDFGDPVVLVPPRPVTVGLDPNLQSVVSRWKPPTIRPFVLERRREHLSRIRGHCLIAELALSNRAVSAGAGSID